MSTHLLKKLLQSYVSAYFSLNFEKDLTSLKISMNVHSPVINTEQIPKTMEIIKTFFPSVLSTKCFNDENLPFAQEVKKTEIGHLFEHILLENLCIEKMKSGASFAQYNGRTYWDWVLNPQGSFLIDIKIEEEDLIYFPQSLKRTISLVELILKTAEGTYSKNDSIPVALT